MIPGRQMTGAFTLPPPRIVPPLDPGFRPPALANRAFAREVEESHGSVPLVIALERPDGSISRFETCVLPGSHPRFEAAVIYAERLFKFLLWQLGGWRAWVGGPAAVGNHLRSVYSPEGSRAFDYSFMSEVFERPFTIVPCEPDEVPPALERPRPIGRHLDGCRIGFDLGASDRKVSAVVDGRAVYSEEVIWSPSTEPDPAYHYREIRAALESAAARMPRLDAVGGSAAGIYVDDTVRGVASIFRSVPRERAAEVRGLFHRLRDEFDVPLVVVNDGDVTALAGSMSLGENAVLGIAMGSSEAAGYVNPEGKITGWLNELAFAPVDYQPDAPVDEWSGDRGIGASYLSQQSVFRLAPLAGVPIPANVPPAERLETAQSCLAQGHEGALAIWRTMGVYLGYTLAHYADFYALRHVLVLGRCTSGLGGPVILDETRRVLGAEFPDLASRLDIQLPEEKSRRVGQAIAAASLPALRRT
ncbi:MAG: ROK family protein [Vicinamibacterales bacterium]